MNCSMCNKPTDSKESTTNSILLTKDRIRTLFSYAGILKYIIDQVDKIDLDYDNDYIIEKLNEIKEENPLIKEDLDFLDEIYSFVKIDGMPL